MTRSLSTLLILFTFFGSTSLASQDLSNLEEELASLQNQRDDAILKSKDPSRDSIVRDLDEKISKKSRELNTKVQESNTRASTRNNPSPISAPEDPTSPEPTPPTTSAGSPSSSQQEMVFQKKGALPTPNPPAPSSPDSGVSEIHYPVKPSPKRSPKTHR